MVKQRCTTSKAGNRKTKKLSKEALKVTDDKAKEIAESLCKSAIAGDVCSVRMLVELAEGTVDGEEAGANLPLRSVAQELAAEPQWTGPIPD
jgi:signal transduction histidine kinase